MAVNGGFLSFVAALGRLIAAPRALQRYVHALSPVGRFLGATLDTRSATGADWVRAMEGVDKCKGCAVVFRLLFVWTRFCWVPEERGQRVFRTVLRESLESVWTGLLAVGFWRRNLHVRSIASSSFCLEGCPIWLDCGLLKADPEPTKATMRRRQIQ